MLLQQYGRVAAGVVVSCGLQLLASAPARACLCLDPPLVWPKADSVVSSDTAIVVETLVFGRDPSNLNVKLLDADGSELALNIVQRLPDAYACHDELTFLRPERELEPGREYTVAITQAAGENPNLTKFSAREKSERREAAGAPEITYLAVKQHPECDDGLSQCVDLAELRVEYPRAFEEPAWLVVRSHAPKYQLNRWEFSADAWSQPPLGPVIEEPKRVAQLSLMLPPDDPCVELSIYGSDGRTLFEERRCEPDRCAVFLDRISSTCGETPHSNLDASRVPPGTCDDPPVLDDDDAGIAYPQLDVERDEEQDAGPQVRLRTRRAPDCQALPLRAARTAAWPLMLVASVGLLLLRRRRQRYWR
jgi:hypothetical protein